MNKKIWTSEQVDNLIQRQNEVNLHPYTCPSEFCPNPNDREYRKLIPTVTGWVCKCGKYKQKWAHQEDVDGIKYECEKYLNDIKNCIIQTQK